MSGFTTTATLATLRTRLSTAFADAMASAPVFSDRLKLYTPADIDTESLTLDWLASLGGMREWVGPRIVEGFKERAYQITTKHWEKTVGVNQDKLDDSPMTAIADAGLRMKLFTEGARKLEDDLLVDSTNGLLVQGHTKVCYDGQNFFDTDHPADIDLVTGTQSNYESTGFALTAANLQTAWARMASFVGENGRPLGSNPNILVVPPALKKTADDIVTAQFGASGASNMQWNMMQVQVIPELQAISTTAWYLFDTQSAGFKPFILLNRSPLKMAALTAPTDENVFWRNEVVFGIDRRVGAGYGAWFKAFKGVA
jgi:phage major head subunit gpT-like protein